MNRHAKELLDLVCAAPDDPRPMPQVVLLAAHPDDEVIGAGARLPRLRGAVICHVTDGVPRDVRHAQARGFATRHDYATARRSEVEAALALAGIPPGQIRAMGFVDQEASLCLADVALATAEVFRELRAEVAITHPYEGGHPDHDSAAFAAYAAGLLLRKRGLHAPVVIEMRSYHDTPSGVTVEFLPAADCEVATLRLTKPERAFKRSLLACFRTQGELVRLCPIKVECFRFAPCYDFTCPPHAGTLLYEKVEMGITGSRWRESATMALQTLIGSS